MNAVVPGLGRGPPRSSTEGERVLGIIPSCSCHTSVRQLSLLSRESQEPLRSTCSWPLLFMQRMFLKIAKVLINPLPLSLFFTHYPPTLPFCRLQRGGMKVFPRLF